MHVIDMLVRKVETVKAGKEGILLHVKVTPNADTFKIKGVNPWTGRLEVTLSSPARKGKANEEVIEKLGTMLQKKVVLKAGRTSRKKLLLIHATSKHEVLQSLGLERER